MGFLALAVGIALVGILVYIIFGKFVATPKFSKNKQFYTYNITATLFILFALFFSYLWVYWLVVMYSFPSVVVSFLLTKKGASIIKSHTYTKVNYALIALSITISVVSLVWVYIEK